jgi:hypothetical protein
VVSTGISAVESVTTRSAALTTSRVNHRRRVRSGIFFNDGGESSAMIGGSLRPERRLDSKLDMSGAGEARGRRG